MSWLQSCSQSTMHCAGACTLPVVEKQMTWLILYDIAGLSFWRCLKLACWRLCSCICSWASRAGNGRPLSCFWISASSKSSLQMLTARQKQAR